MDYWNFFAARHEARSGATTFGGMPPFFEATGGRATLDTTMERYNGFAHRQQSTAAGVGRVRSTRGEFRGVQLDEEIPGSMTRRRDHRVRRHHHVERCSGRRRGSAWTRYTPAARWTTKAATCGWLPRATRRPAIASRMSLTFDRATRYGLQVGLGDPGGRHQRPGHHPLELHDRHHRSVTPVAADGSRTGSEAQVTRYRYSAVRQRRTRTDCCPRSDAVPASAAGWCHCPRRC